MLHLLSCRATQLRPVLPLGFVANFKNTPSYFINTKRFSTDERTSDLPSELEDEPAYDMAKSPWAPENNMLPPKKKNNNARFRQHVNPLARKYQMQTEIDEEWPNDGTFTDPSLPIHIDIGCGKGGFLLDLCGQRVAQPNDGEGEKNYLGLEIRPSVVQYAKERVEKHGLSGRLDFIGCNANVDLERLVSRYTKYGSIDLVSIQYPDPHFKVSEQDKWALKYLTCATKRNQMEAEYARQSYVMASLISVDH